MSNLFVRNLSRSPNTRRSFFQGFVLLGSLLFVFTTNPSTANALSIWVGSMNIENQPFNDETLATMLLPALKSPPTSTAPQEIWAQLRAQLPEVLVIACQECKSNHKFQHAGTQLVKEDRLGPAYSKLKTENILGLTKFNQGFSNIYVAVLVRAEMMNQFTKVVSYSTRRSAKLKGASFVQFTHESKTYAFGSVHLDASSEENRELDIKAIAKKLKKFGFKLNPKTPESNRAALLIGDFNYRIAKDNSSSARNSPTFLIQKIQESTADLDELAKRDALRISLTAGHSFAPYGFGVPKYTKKTLPTYKRAYSTPQNKTDCRTLVSAKSNSPAFVRALTACYFKGGKVIKDKQCLKESRCLDFGWLDRIAVVGVAFDPTKSLFPPVSPETAILKLRHYTDARGAVLGDHSAIWAILDSVQ